LLNHSLQSAWCSISSNFVNIRLVLQSTFATGYTALTPSHRQCV